jgi:hypothetical protein
VTPGSPARQRGPLLAVALLVAGLVTWAAFPVSGGGAGTRPVLIIATCCAAGSLLRTAERIRAQRPAARRRAPGYLMPTAERWLAVWSVITAAPWAQGLTVAVLALEALHRPRAWHTAVLGAVLLGFLLALHLAESAARPSALRPQLPLVLAGLCLAGLAAAAAALPTARAGSGWLSVVAAIAALVVAALALPV